MLKSAAKDYSKYLDVDLESKLQPINQSIDEMLMRLEEFESMVALVQQERCNAIGITGALIEAMDYQKELTDLCLRIDTLQNLIKYIKENINILEKKIEIAEEHFGLTDNANRLKNFFLPLFKKGSEAKPTETACETGEEFSTDTFFSKDETL